MKKKKKDSQIYVVKLKLGVLDIKKISRYLKCSLLKI